VEKVRTKALIQEPDDIEMQRWDLERGKKREEMRASLSLKAKRWYLSEIQTRARWT